MKQVRRIGFEDQTSVCLGDEDATKGAPQAGPMIYEAHEVFVRLDENKG